MECPIMNDTNAHLALLDKQDTLEEQVQSELIDGDHLDDFREMPMGAFDEAMAYLLRKAIVGNEYIGEEFEAYKMKFVAAVTEKIKKNF